jgi:hypothetical protein
VPSPFFPKNYSPHPSTVVTVARSAQRAIDEAKVLLEKRAAELRASAEDMLRAATALE